MTIRTQLTGMTGVYLAAAELSHRGFVVSPTSRSAKAADLLVTDQGCVRTWSVQVKTNARHRTNWPLSEGDGAFASGSHVYVFVNLMGGSRPEYVVVPSKQVAAKICTEKNQSGAGSRERTVRVAKDGTYSVIRFRRRFASAASDSLRSHSLPGRPALLHNASSGPSGTMPVGLMRRWLP